MEFAENSPTVLNILASSMQTLMISNPIMETIRQVHKSTTNIQWLNKLQPPNVLNKHATLEMFTLNRNKNWIFLIRTWVSCFFKIRMQTIKISLKWPSTILNPMIKTIPIIKILLCKIMTIQSISILILRITKIKIYSMILIKRMNQILWTIIRGRVKIFHFKAKASKEVLIIVQTQIPIILKIPPSNIVRSTITISTIRNPLASIHFYLMETQTPTIQATPTTI